MPATEPFDFVIFGSGFGGSILSMILRRLGYSVALLERGAHPRFVIGESSTPFANLLLERLAREYDLPFLRSLSEWGSWQRDLPQIPCGLKRGFTFYHHTPGRPADFSDRAAQLLVAASPNDQAGDTHWYRPAFDHFLAGQAEALGAAYFDHAEVQECSHEAGWKLGFTARGRPRRIAARFAIDASGASGFLPQRLAIASQPFTSMPATRAVYAHFEGVGPLPPWDDPGLPYPPEDAAVHHVFEEGWIWVLRFNNGLTSAGAALKSGGPQEAPETVWNGLLARFPTLARQFAPARPATPFYSIPQVSFRRARCAGADWALLPSAAGFIDPLLSTGFALNLLGIRRLAQSIQRQESLAGYERATFAELDAAAGLIGALYSKMASFEEFAALSLLYFTAMSFTENAWRLGRPGLAGSFLLEDQPEFARLRETLCGRARAGGWISREETTRALKPWDVAGLTDLTRRNWFPFPPPAPG